MRFPSFSGKEPCAEMGTVWYYADHEHQGEGNQYHTILPSLCNRCDMLNECFEWALHHEEHGYWGGTSPEQRKRIRRERNIKLEAPAHWAWLPRVRSDVA